MEINDGRLSRRPISLPQASHDDSCEATPTSLSAQASRVAFMPALPLTGKLTLGRLHVVRRRHYSTKYRKRTDRTGYDRVLGDLVFGYFIIKNATDYRDAVTNKSLQGHFIVSASMQLEIRLKINRQKLKHFNFYVKVKILLTQL